MSDLLGLISVLATGILLGFLFFGGLWWTVRQVAFCKYPALVVFASLILRMTMVLVGFYFISDGNIHRLLMCLLGFIIARLIVTRLTGPPVQRHNASTKEADHAA